MKHKFKSRREQVEKTVPHYRPFVPFSPKKGEKGYLNPFPQMSVVKEEKTPPEELMRTAKLKIQSIPKGIRIGASSACFNPLPPYESVLEEPDAPEVRMKRAKDKVAALVPGIKVSVPPENPFPEYVSVLEVPTPRETKMKRALDKLNAPYVPFVPFSPKSGQNGYFNPLPSPESVPEFKTDPKELMKTAMTKINNMPKGLKIGAPADPAFLPKSIYMMNLPTRFIQHSMQRSATTPNLRPATSMGLSSGVTGAATHH